MIEQLLLPAIQQFIDDHINDQPAELMLKASQFPDWPMKAIVEQIVSKKKARQKLPEWFAISGIIWPTAISMEQCSSKETAEYKASLVSGKAMVDLTGGFGVDTYYLSKNFEKACHVELNPELHKVVSHNFELLESDVDTFLGSAKDYLESMGPRDLIYLDPARRDDEDRKVVFLEDYSPNVIQLLPALRKRSNQILIKVSPMLDIKKAIDDLGFVDEVHVVAVKNEVKELLFLLGSDKNKNPRIKAVNLVGERADSFEFRYSDEENAVAQLSPVNTYLYEPNTAILKAGGFKSLPHQFNLKKLEVNSHLYTSEMLVEDFPGRVFKVVEQLSFNKKRLKKQLKSDQANITVRNFPMSVKEIRKKTGLKEGGNQYILATTDVEAKKVLLCEKV